MPKNLKRYYGRGDLHFLAFSCYRRLPLLKTMRARNLFVQALGRIRERYKFLLVGYVVMPNHVHLLISESPGGTPSVVLKVFREKLEYMHTNPVARKLVDHPKDWPWSSWSLYTKGEAGLVPIDPVE